MSVDGSAVELRVAQDAVKGGAGFVVHSINCDRVFILVARDFSGPNNSSR